MWEFEFVRDFGYDGFDGLRGEEQHAFGEAERRHSDLGGGNKL